jgi:hypothetical protein
MAAKKLPLPLYSVTRLGEFSPLGRLLTLGNVFENYRSGPKFGATFFDGKCCVHINGLCYILGDFFHKLIWSACSFFLPRKGEKYQNTF